jgi:LuxR family maltose regulon positive regulatory protein
MLEWLEQANLFVVSLDSSRQWYRYHALFAEALRYRLEHTMGDLVPSLHYRASIWYGEHQQTTQAILHAFSARQWQWAADLIEHTPSLLSLTWGAAEHELVLLRQSLEQLPVDVIRSLPRLYLACAQLLWQFVSHPMLEVWLNAAQAAVMHAHGSYTMLDQQVWQQEQENLLGEIFSIRAMMRSFKEDGQTVLSLCEQALALVSAENYLVRVQVAIAQIIASYASSENDAVAAVQYGLQGVSLAQTTGQPTLVICMMGTTVYYMIAAGRLHEAQQLTQQAILLGTNPEGLVLPDVGCPTFWQAEILRERNELDVAFSLTEEAISLCKQAESLVSSVYVFCGYAVLMRIHLSRGELEAARSTLQQIERIGKHMNQSWYGYLYSLLTTIDQVRLWLACGELDRATRWARELDRRERHGSPLVREREDVARVHILLAKSHPDLALEQLEPLLSRATIAQRWTHVIEIRLLQALAYRMCQEEAEALNSLSEAVRLAEPEGYIRSFVDEGSPMAALLSMLREQQRQHGPTGYLDTVLAAFPQQSKAQKCQPKRTKQRSRRDSS